MQDLSFPTRDQTNGPCNGSTESQALDHKGSPWILYHSFVCVCVCVRAHVHVLNCVWLFAALWTIAHQAPLSMEFSRQEYWSGVPFPSLGDLLDPGIKPLSLAFSALADRFFTTSVTWEAPFLSCLWSISWNQYLCQIFAIAWILWDRNGWSHWL